MYVARVIFAVGISLGMIASVNATPMLKLTSGASEVLVSDGGAGDSSGAGDGIVAFNGALGNWTLNVATGISKPALGSADTPELDLNSVNLSSAGAASTVNIWLTDTDFSAKSSLVGMVAAIGGTTSGQISYRTFYDAGNTAFGTANELTNVGPLSDAAFSSLVTSAFSSVTKYSLTLLVSITHAASTTSRVSSFDAFVRVPEPSSLLLFGAGLLALVYVVRRQSAGRRAR
jgi:hypothetical protein